MGMLIRDLLFMGRTGHQEGSTIATKRDFLLKHHIVSETL